MIAAMNNIIIEIEKILPGILETDMLYKSEDLSVNINNLNIIDIASKINPKNNAILNNVLLARLY
jgi:hypothetical protein